VPPLHHLISCTPTKSNLYLLNSLAAAVSEPALYMILTFHVPNLLSLFRCLNRTKVSIQACCACSCFVTNTVFTLRNCQHISQHPIWRTTPCRLSATAYSVYSQLPSILEAVPPSATWGRAMPCRDPLITGTLPLSGDIWGHSLRFWEVGCLRTSAWFIQCGRGL
jgi:hypothetical protein